MLREKGDLFEPFETRMTRDYGSVYAALHQRRQTRRHRRGKSSDLDFTRPVAATLPASTVKHGSQAPPADSKMMDAPEQMVMSRGPVMALRDGSQVELPPDAALLAALAAAPKRPARRSGLQRSWSVAY